MTVISSAPSQVRKNHQSVSAILKAAALQIANLVKRQYIVHKQQRINRQAFSQMLTLDDSMLADIGVGRDDVIWASKLPIEVNAANELDTIRSLAKRQYK